MVCQRSVQKKKKEVTQDRELQMGGYQIDWYIRLIEKMLLYTDLTEVGEHAVWTWGKRIPGRQGSKIKDPETWVCSMCPWLFKEDSVTGMEKSHRK